MYSAITLHTILYIIHYLIYMLKFTVVFILLRKHIDSIHTLRIHQIDLRHEYTLTYIV